MLGRFLSLIQALRGARGDADAGRSARGEGQSPGVSRRAAVAAGGASVFALLRPPAVEGGGAPGEEFAARPGVWFDVRAAGARGDARRAADGAVTAGSAVIRSAAIRFAPSDVGKHVGVGNAHVAWIVEVRGPNTAVLSAPSAFAGRGLRISFPRGRTWVDAGDVSVARGAAEVTTAGPVFDPVDVGTRVWVGGAAAGTVEAVEGTGRARISATPGFDMTGAEVLVGTDDTRAVQAAVDAATAAGDGVVSFPPGSYLVSAVDVGPGITLTGARATLLRPALTPGEFTRMITTHNRAWADDADSPPLTVRGLTLDGTRRLQGPYLRYELEHAALLYLSGSGGARARRGRLRAVLDRCTFRDSPADGPGVGTNVDVHLTDCAAVDCFRGGVTVTGGYSSIRITRFVGRGEVHPTGLQFEVDGGGYAGTDGGAGRSRHLDVDVVIEGAIIDGDFDCGLGEGRGTFVARDVVCKGPSFYVFAPHARVRISDSTFVVAPSNGMSNRVVHPGDVTFTRCRFTLVRPAPTSVRNLTHAALLVVWNRGSTALRGQQLRLEECAFAVAPGASPDARAIHTAADDAALGNRLTLTGCEVEPGFRYGLYMFQGGGWRLRRTRIAAAVGIFYNAGGRRADVELEGVRTEGAVAIQINSDSRGARGEPTSRLATSAMEGDEARSVVAAGRYGSDLRYEGGRLILVGRDPTRPGARLSGLRGDRARLRAPVPGEPFEWVCTRTGFASGGPAAVWTPVARLA